MIDQGHLWLPYCQMQTAPDPLEVESAEGARLHLRDGRTLIDGIASWWTVCHGYNHPEIRGAVVAQLERLPHVMLGGLVNRPALDLARRLAALLPGTLEHVFFSESGSVAVEVAMKIAVQYWLNQGQHGRTRFVSFRYGYHGDTWAAMSVSDPDDSMHKRFAGALLEQYVVALPRTAGELRDFERYLARHRGEVAGVLIEPLLQAAGGMRMHEPEVLAGIAAAVARQGLLLIADEIATGFGRTGTLFACEQAEVVPDLMTLSKALTGGTLPLAATVASDAVFAEFLSSDPTHALMHGPTFSGHALAAAAAHASLDLFEREPRLAEVAAIEAALADGLAPCRGASRVVDVRVKGAVGAVELEPGTELGRLRASFIERGVWIRPLGNVIYLMPPFVISAAELETLLAAVREAVLHELA